jgi:aldehyde:ferredoxin oxidoreductase
MASMFGWAGKILEIDLSSGKVGKLDFDRGLREKFIGGRGVNAKILYDSIGPETDAFSPENVLIFGTGPMIGTGVPSGARLNVTCKSALSTYGCSNAGGHFAPELKKAGYDHIIIKGKAEMFGVRENGTVRRHNLIDT